MHAVSGTSPLQTPLASSELRSACVLISISGTMRSVLIEGDIPLSELTLYYAQYISYMYSSRALTLVLEDLP